MLCFLMAFSFISLIYEILFDTLYGIIHYVVNWNKTYDFTVIRLFTLQQQENSTIIYEYTIGTGNDKLSIPKCVYVLTGDLDKIGLKTA